ncbi:MAG TPA: N-glycosylase/DNA lyase [Pyrinomonadaceae bacterium]|nr:N-glycosylase/DNA lyase [Pyrinomonadaceae bacterium]
MAKKELTALTIDNIKRVHKERRAEIKARLAEFAEIGRVGSDEDLFAEMVFCFFTGGCSARMGINSLAAVRDMMMTADREALTQALLGSHRYPNARSRYIVHSRDFLQNEHGMRLREKLVSYTDNDERRDWLVREKGIKGLGYKEASHYLRNIGYKGYAILDKHVLNCLAELKIIDEPKPPNTRSRYLSVEGKLRQFAMDIKIDLDEIDLVLWSMKTGHILK